MTPVPAVDAATFAAVIFGVVALGVLVAAVWAVAGRDGFDHIGRGGLWSDRGRPGDDDEARDEEIGQMLAARRARSARRGAGEPAADCQGEGEGEGDEAAGSGRPGSARPPALRREDREVAEEVRQLAVARNARRQRQGLEPLDIEAEVARRLDEL